MREEAEDFQRWPLTHSELEHLDADARLPACLSVWPVPTADEAIRPSLLLLMLFRSAWFRSLPSRAEPTHSAHTAKSMVSIRTFLFGEHLLH